MSQVRHSDIRDVILHPPDRSVRGDDITTAEWMDALGVKKRPMAIPTEKASPVPVDILAMIERTMRAVAASADSGHYAQAARLLRELRATDEYLRRCGARKPFGGDSSRPSESRPRAVPTKRSMTADVDEWLKSFLESGERRAVEVYTAGKAMGFSESQLQRSGVRIGVELRKVGFPPKSYWRLAGHERAANDFHDVSDHLSDDRDIFTPRLDDMDRWLRDFLGSGPKPSDEVRRCALAAGWRARELRDARKRIGAAIQKAGYPCRTTWLLRERQGGKS